MIRAFKGVSPRIDPSAFVDESAQVLGDVELGPGASIWLNTVIRADVGPIRIGARTNIQDLCVVHCTRGSPEPGARPPHHATVGEDVTVGHSVTLHGCTIRDRVLIGMGAIVLDGAVIAEDSMVAAGSLVPPGATFPPRSLILGSPAKVKRPLTDEEVAFIRQSALNYIGYAADHRGG